MKSIQRYIQSVFERFRYRRRGTVRTMFSLSLLGVVLLLSAAALTAQDASYIRLEMDKTAVKAGDRLSLDVFAYAHTPVNAVDVTLNFDPNAVKVLGVDKGQSVLTIWTEEPLIEDDKVILRGGTYRKGFVGDHKLATIELEAKGTGESEFSTGKVLLLAGDGQGTPVTIAQADDSRASLYIYDENSAPEDLGVSVAVKIVTDIDGDGKVSLKDISAFMGAWADTSYIYDFNGDGKMTIRDFSIILSDVFFGT